MPNCRRKMKQIFHYCISKSTDNRISRFYSVHFLKINFTRSVTSLEKPLDFQNSNIAGFIFNSRIGAAVSCSREFLICIKFCETVVIVLGPPAACFVRLVCI